MYAFIIGKFCVFWYKHRRCNRGQLWRSKEKSKKVRRWVFFNKYSNQSLPNFGAFIWHLNYVSDHIWMCKIMVVFVGNITGVEGATWAQYFSLVSKSSWPYFTIDIKKAPPNFGVFICSLYYVSVRVLIVPKMMFFYMKMIGATRCYLSSILFASIQIIAALFCNWHQESTAKFWCVYLQRL